VPDRDRGHRGRRLTEGEEIRDDANAVGAGVTEVLADATAVVIAPDA
jgi:hypothetical protein